MALSTFVKKGKKRKKKGKEVGEGRRSSMSLFSALMGVGPL